MARKGAMTPKQFTADYVLGRRDALVKRFGRRNARMDIYQDMYAGKMWKEPMLEDEYRITLPIAWDTVEKVRALIITRPPSITVPASTDNPDEMDTAQKKEAWLYGVMSVCNFQQVLGNAEWFADCLGRGWLKATYDDEAYDDEVPVLLTAPDPRTLYYTISPRRDRVTELVQTWRRRRRDIETEWGTVIPRPSIMPDKDTSEADWLDSMVNYIEYWTEVPGYVTEDVNYTKAAPKKTFADRANEIFVATMANEPTGPGAQQQAPGMAGPVLPGAMGTPEAPPGLGQPPPGAPTPNGALVAEGGEETPEKPQRRRIRKILHAVMIEDEPGEQLEGTSTSQDRGLFLKKPIFVPGYRSIPFFGWSGISTPLQDGLGDLSVLFPIANGDADTGGAPHSLGMLAAWNQLMSLNLQEAVQTANSAWVVDDPDAHIDTRSGVMNVIKPGSKVQRLNTAENNQTAMAMSDVISNQVSRVTIPAVWEGSAQNLSGQAISGFATVFQMIIGQKQHDRETALSNMLSHVLMMAREYATEGWAVWGTNSAGKYVEETLSSDDIGNDLRVMVKLSSSMPKDDMGTISMLSNLLARHQISWETFLDQFQHIYGIASDTVKSEMRQALRDRILETPQISEGLGGALSTELIGRLLGQGTPLTFQQLFQQLSGMSQTMLAPPPPPAPPQPPPQPPQGPPPGPPGPQGPPGGPPMPQGGGPGPMPPTMGLPPQSLPSTPELLAANQQLSNQMGLEGSREWLPPRPNLPMPPFGFGGG